MLWDSIPINQIDTRAIQEFLNCKSRYSEKYLKEMKTLLSQILESAKKDGLIDDNPANDNRLSIPSSKKKERTALTVAEMVEIVKAVDDLNGDEQRYLAIVMFTGMRRGEILGLR